MVARLAKTAGRWRCKALWPYLSPRTWRRELMRRHNASAPSTTRSHARRAPRRRRRWAAATRRKRLPAPIGVWGCAIVVGLSSFALGSAPLVGSSHGMRVVCRGVSALRIQGPNHAGGHAPARSTCSTQRDTGLRIFAARSRIRSMHVVSRLVGGGGSSSRRSPPVVARRVSSLQPQVFGPQSCANR